MLLCWDTRWMMVWQNESVFFFFEFFFILQKRILEGTPKYELVQASLQKKKSLFPSTCLIWRATSLHRNPQEKKKRWKSGKVQAALALEQRRGMWWKQKALLLGWEHESALSSKANPGCILMETGCACPDMLCVWVPLFITLNTSSGLRQAQRHNCHRCSQLQPMIYYLAVFCPTWVHITAHNVALLQRALLCF